MVEGLVRLRVSETNNQWDNELVLFQINNLLINRGRKEFKLYLAKLIAVDVIAWQQKLKELGKNKDTKKNTTQKENKDIYDECMCIFEDLLKR